MNTRRPLLPLLSAALTLTACASGGGGDSELALSPDLGAQVLPPGRVLVVRDDLRLPAGDYLRPAQGPGGRHGVLLLEGLSGVRLDLGGAHLRGGRAGLPLERSVGAALVIRGCTDVEVRGGELSGYKTCIVVENSSDVVLEGITFSDYFAEPLSTPGVSGPEDTIDPRSRRGETWAERFGAAIHVLDGSRVTVRGCRARGGQNGLLLVRSEGCEVVENDFSFLSGWGVGLHGSSGCRVVGNRLDYCARSSARELEPDGRGAMGLLLAGGCTGNTIARNSATHCGDGARFLAGSEERAGAFGAGERNLWLENDFSRAIGIGLYVEGARGDWILDNRFQADLATGLELRACSGLLVARNAVEDVLGPAVAALDARDCVFTGNELRGCDQGLSLRSSAAGEAAVSSDLWVEGNGFASNLQDLVLDGAHRVVLTGNTYHGKGEQAVHLDGLVGEGAPDLRAREVWRWSVGPDGSLPSGRGWQSSLTRADGARHPLVETLAAFEPPALDHELPPAREGAGGLASIVIGSHGPWDFESDATPPNVPLPGGLLGGLWWSASWFRWDATCDPRGDLAAWRARRYDPVARGRVRAWNDPWGGAGTARQQTGDERFGLHAVASLPIFESGRYRLRALSDDGVRLLLDGEAVLEDWSWHPARRQEVELDLESGLHQLEVEYFQIDGAAVLALELELLPSS